MTRDNPLDKPNRPEDRTAVDQADGKAVRGWEDIEGKGHDRGHGDAPVERKPQKGY